MKFLNRVKELNRLNKAVSQSESVFIVIWGRRRVGKTRLLLEWVSGHNGLYWVADESSAAVQRQYFAETLETFLPGFASVQYPDWGSLFTRLAVDAEHKHWRGPLVIDEFPYLVSDSPELPSILQRFIDHEAKRAKLIVAISGSSQRMMQGLVLNADEPLYGRAQEIIKLKEIPLRYISEALNLENPYHCVQAYSIWGGIPRYWEFAAPFKENILESIEALVLDPDGPLQEEPHRLLIEETPSALGLRPILDVIGLGSHKLSEIAGRLGQPSTSLSRPIERLKDLEFIEKEIPFGCHEASSKRTLYKIRDPFLRFWYEVVAPKRSIYMQISKKARLELIKDIMPHIFAQSWEELCRQSVPMLFENKENLFFEPARRFWHGNGPEWDIASLSLDHKILLIGEVKWTINTPSVEFVQNTISKLISKGTPTPLQSGTKILYAIFIPIKPKETLTLPENVRVFDATDVLIKNLEAR